MKKKQLMLMLTSLLMSVDLFAAGGGNNFETLEEAIGWAKEAIQGIIANSFWLLAIIPVGAAGYSWKIMKEYLENKEETSQFEPKWQKNGKLIVAALGGVVVTFLTYGIFGAIFFGKGFMETWELLVVRFWTDAANMAN